MRHVRTHYEVYAYCSTQTDVVEVDTLEEAEAIALKWSMESIDVDIAIDKVEEEKIKCFRNGGQVL